MNRIKVTVTLPHGTHQMELLQFIVYPDPKEGPQVLAICADSDGNIDTYAFDSVKINK